MHRSATRPEFWPKQSSGTLYRLHQSWNSWILQKEDHVSKVTSDQKLPGKVWNHKLCACHAVVHALHNMLCVWAPRRMSKKCCISNQKTVSQVFLSKRGTARKPCFSFHVTRVALGLRHYVSSAIYCTCMGHGCIYSHFWHHLSKLRCSFAAVWLRRSQLSLSWCFCWSPSTFHLPPFQWWILGQSSGSVTSSIEICLYRSSCSSSFTFNSFCFLCTASSCCGPRSSRSPWPWSFSHLCSCETSLKDSASFKSGSTSRSPNPQPPSWCSVILKRFSGRISDDPQHHLQNVTICV